ncbi:F-actin-monooxygenase MICAL3 isoform X18 [Canis lupus baileyi]|uniref:F-actin monooxygenase n=2 Tax=Canis lupus TaxID=9612 RepID=A0A8I3Q5H8_CANLF|nr:F-actin-monooxygenase MICAL3 isoform X19 [Canis lupus familiaris]XP_025317367.3 F-actin-monooxygenase MICAL3 isoform X19 [Canis lupus dingo]XP_038295493.1 F-actin-monooxygenase MICAL3 isoform X19 [Canis lupus familiaris]XP_038432153.1 F-actin-monooxygenase MICAL3 isoform X19 [Canis lupus familiaris]|eukprot:XP_022266603.1 F-actin-methionine sulfoxide oxidase MICAL3 isoform X21 [Canis lupus familiaris]
MEDSKNETVNHAHVLFDRFVQATTCKGTLKAFQELCDHLELKPKDYRSFYHKLKSKLNYWKAKALWAKLDKRGSHKDYKKGKACTNTKCLIIGAGPCGLRTAIDLSLLGAKVVVIEKRDAFSRNNVLHLWPFTIHDLRGLGAKKFYGKFCAGAIDHISIRQLQLILLKVALILGIEIHVNVEFQGLVQPPEDQENERIGWRALVHPKTHPVSEYEFEVIIGGDGRRNTLEGFRRKEFRGKLAIAITANFINRNTTAEAKVEEISGVAFIFNQKFFQELKEATGIDLENIVYYKDDTHYFVMTAKKQSLLDKGVILHDYADTELLLSRENVDQEALLNYAREAADFSTQQQLPSLDFAINHYGQPDVAMFDFTCMYASENAALVREQNGHQLLVALVGDSLLEPFWPMGTGIARGFLAAMDSAWMVRSWSLGTSPLEVLAERESIYRLLPQTTPENVSKNFSQYSIDPVTRYPNININFLRPSQVRHLYNTGETRDIHLEMENLVNSRTTPKLTRNESVARSSKLLGWCQRQTDGYAGVNVTDLTMSWKSGLALCAIIHRYRPDLIDFDSLDEQNVEKNNQLAFDIAEKELGISPIMTGKEMASVGEPDKLSMVMYLTQFYEMFKDSLPSSDALDLNAEEKAVLIASTKSPISFLSKLGQTISRKRSPKDKKEKDLDGAGKRRKTSQSEEEEAPRGYRGGRPTLVSTLTDRRMDVALGNQNKVKYMATQLLAKFEENAPPQSTGMRRQGSIKKEFPQNLGGSDTCYFCRKRVYVMERLSAEGKFFHRSCFKCEYCATTLRLSAYAYDIEDGKFYCKPHYCYRLSGSAQRKRPAVAPLSGKEAREPLQDGPTVDTNGRASAVTSPAERTPGSSVNGVEEPSIAKRLRGTPERIELENYRLSVKQAEELEEVPEETQAEHNLSSVLDTGAEEDVASSSSESEMEEEEEEEPPLPTSDLGGVPWKEAVRIHALLKGKSEEELEASKSFGPGHEEDEEEEEYEEEEEEEEEEYEEEEEEEESSEVGSQRLQQIVNPADPLEIQADVHWTHIREREEEERMVPTSESSTSRVPFDENDLEEDVDSEPAKIEGEATENGDTGDTGAELDDDQRWSDGIPSDAETDLRVQHQEAVEADLELRVSENEEEPPEVTPGHPERSLTRVPSPALSPEEQAGLRSPGHSPKAEGAQIPLVSVVTKAKLPEENLFPKPLLPKVKPKVEVPCSQRAACSPIRSQPVALPEARTPTSPVSSQCLSPLATSTPTSTQLPICSQPQPSSETTAPSPTKSPIRLQPVSAKTSIPVVPLPLKNQGDTKDRLGSPLAVDEALKRNDLVAEFWMKSAEIRRSLGLTPVDRSKVYEPSFPSPAFKPVSLKSYAVEKSPEGEGLQLLKPPPVPKRLGLPKSDGDQPFLPTPKSPSDRELKSSQEERRDLSSSSGLGLHGSSSNMKTLGSQSFNTSDSTMLTPPSSPPPPPPQDEEPATLRRKPYQTHEHKDAEPKASVIPPPPPATFMRAPREPTQPLQEEMRKSFVESVDEIPFADDVEDTYDDKTEDSSLQEKFFTPPSYWPRTERPLHPPLAKENGRLPTLESGVQPQKRGLPLVSPEAKELAEERMRAREKSVKSQALRDAMAKQLSKMKEMEMAAGTSSPPGGTSHKASSVPSKGKDLSPESPRRPVLKGPREPALKHEATSEEVLSPPSDSGGPDGSVTSSEGSSGKSKKRSSLFSPRRNKKEKKSKGEGRPPEKPSPSLLEEAAAKPKSLWKSVFSGYKKDKKKKGDDKSCSSTPSSGATVDSGKHKMSPVVRAELHLRRQLSFSEDSDLSSDDILERSSQKSRREPRTYTEEELNAKLTRRVQKAARRQAKQEELKRLHRAQIIQRQLEQVEEKQRQLEERGVAVEKALRGEAGMGKKDDPKLMQEWFKLVQEKNAMVRYESELMIFARELELEDRQSRLQQELRERMAVEDHLKTEEELSEEKKILNEMLEVVEQRDALVALLEEQRLREKEEDKDLEAVMLSKGFSLNWS